MTLLATASHPATVAAIRPVTERRVSIHGGDVRGAEGGRPPRAGAHALIAYNLCLRYLRIAVVEGGLRLGDPAAGTVASLTSTGFSVVSGGMAWIAGRPCWQACSPASAATAITRPCTVRLPVMTYRSWSATFAEASRVPAE